MPSLAVSVQRSRHPSRRLLSLRYSLIIVLLLLVGVIFYDRLYALRSAWYNMEIYENGSVM